MSFLLFAQGARSDFSVLDSVMIAQMACLSLGYVTTPSSASLRRLKTLSPSSKFFARALLAVISTLSVIVTLYRLPSTAPQPWRPGHRMFRAGIWTVHFGFDNRGRDSQHKIRNLIRYEIVFTQGDQSS